MFIIRNIPEEKYFVDIKHVTVIADSPDLSDSVTELALALHTFLSKKQYLNIQGVGLLFHVKD